MVKLIYNLNLIVAPCNCWLIIQMIYTCWLYIMESSVTLLNFAYNLWCQWKCTPFITKTQSIHNCLLASILVCEKSMWLPIQIQR